MELWVLLESLEELVNLVHLVSLVLQEPKVIWVHLVLKEVGVFKVQEDHLENLECLVNLEKWDLLVKMVVMEKRGDLVYLVHQDLLAFLDQEDSLD